MREDPESAVSADSRAAETRRGSIDRSPGMSTAPATAGESDGSIRRAALPVMSSVAEPDSDCASRSSRSACRSARSPAHTSVPASVKPRSAAAALATSAANSGYICAEVRINGYRGVCPQTTSAAGAIIPAAAWLAPNAGAGSMMVTSAPRRRRYRAVDRPMIPAPTTMTFKASPSGGMIRIRSDGRLLRPLSLVGRLPRTPLLYDYDHTDATAHRSTADDKSLERGPIG